MNQAWIQFNTEMLKEAQNQLLEGPSQSEFNSVHMHKLEMSDSGLLFKEALQNETLCILH